MKILLITLLIAIPLSFGAYKYSRAGYESAPYEVVSSDGDFEIRDYPSIVLASTPMDRPDPEESSAFMRLFGYITGSNESGEKISMTTPVFMTGSGDEGRMSFVLPQAVAERGAPEATNTEVKIETMNGGRFAAYRFSGSWNLARFEAAKEKLLAWVAQQGLEPAGEPQTANYDPPFTPPMLRRNEVLVRLQQ